MPEHQILGKTLFWYILPSPIVKMARHTLTVGWSKYITRRRIQPYAVYRLLPKQCSTCLETCTFPRTIRIVYDPTRPSARAMFYGTFFIAVLISIAIDMVSLKKWVPTKSGIKEALAWSGILVGVSCTFPGWLYF